MVRRVLAMEDEVHRKSISFDEHSLQQLSVRSRTNSLHCRHLLCPKSRFAKLSRVKHQMGSGLAFAIGDVVPVRNSTDIRSITERPSLFPLMLSASLSIHLAMCLPLPGERYGFTLFRWNEQMA